MKDERTDWNERYRDGSHSSPEPDAFLVETFREFIEPLFPVAGDALDLAGGAGRHAVWLADRNWRVRLVDISDIGIARAKDNAGSRPIETVIRDVSNFTAEREQYDLILVFFYLQREIFSELVEALRPGGILLYKTYTRLHPKFGRGPTHPLHLLQEGELLTAFPGLSVLHYHETVRDRGVAEFVGRKPE